MFCLYPNGFRFFENIDELLFVAICFNILALQNTKAS